MNLINPLGPDRVVLSGWAGATLGAAILPLVRDAVRRHALGYMYGHTLIEVGRLGQEAVALGAATLPIVELLATGGQTKSLCPPGRHLPVLFASSGAHARSADQ